MAVEKYKPKAMPHSQDRTQENLALKVAKTQEASLDAIARSRHIIEQTVDLIDNSRELRRDSYEKVSGTLQAKAKGHSGSA